jgi:hypothetical protein
MQAKPLTIKTPVKKTTKETTTTPEKVEGESIDGQVKVDVLGKIILTSCNLKDRPGIAN